MISKIKIKLIKSLSQKKYRIRENLFVAEGNKLTKEILESGWKVRLLVCTEEYSESNDLDFRGAQEVLTVTDEELRKCSFLKNPQQALALCEIPENDISLHDINKGISLCLDGIQDPGNLGTILRIADWFGIGNIYASHSTADIFNPKVIQSSMGSFLRVRFYYTDLDEIVSAANNQEVPTYGTYLAGRNIYLEKFPDCGLVVIGNEGQGISEQLSPMIRNKIHIPSIHKKSGEGAESLNAAVATAIVCSEFMRGKFRTHSK